MTIFQTLSSDKREKLDRYVVQLGRWRHVTNLIAERSFDDIWKRHIEDVLELQRICPEKRLWLDIGSGAGLPGIVLGILLNDVGGARIHCVESDGRKCAFLRSVVQNLNLPVTVHQKRIESIRDDEIDAVEVVTARAFASLSRIVKLAQRYLDRGAKLVLPRGKTGLAEIEKIDMTRYSVTWPRNSPRSGGVIITIKNRTESSNGSTAAS